MDIDLTRFTTERVKRKRLDMNEWRLRNAEERDCPRVINESWIGLGATGLPLVVSVHLRDFDIDMSGLLEALTTIKYDTHRRTGGMPTTSRIFGYMPRNTLRKDYCSSVALATDQPDQHDAVAQAAAVCERFYAAINPGTYARHAEIARNKVADQWRLAHGVFTSGIINQNNQLPYHFDTGNFKGVWSNMFVFKHDVQGGRLAVPELGVRFELPDHSLLMFDGQGLLHGVTPIELRSDDAFRYSVVFYSLQQMWQCLTPGEELERIRAVKTDREQRRAKELTS